MKATIQTFFMMQVNPMTCQIANDPLQDQIMLVHLNNETGNSDPRVVERAINNKVNLEGVLYEQVIKNLNNNTNSDDAFGGTTTPDSFSNDGGDGSKRWCRQRV